MSRVNHNANYIFDVDGETVWEKLRTIRGMLGDRRRAYELALLKQEQAEAELDETNTYKYREYLINKDFQLSLIEDCKNEVEFLEKFEIYLTQEAEKTRIAGKTDDEMYELNFFEELKTRLVRKAQAQIISTGRIQEDTLLRLMKNNDALDTCIQQGLLTGDVKNVLDTNLLPNPNIHTSNYALLTNKEEIPND
jgi:hypothetical protein